METIEVPFENVTIKQLRPICEHFGCKVKKGKANYFLISSDEPINFFWLGANIQLKINGLKKDLESTFGWYDEDYNQ